MTTEEKAKAYAEEIIVSKAVPGVIIQMVDDVARTAYLAGATEALASQWKDPKVELPEDDAQVVAHSPNGRIDVLTFHDGVFIDELRQAHCVDRYLPIPPLKGGDA